MALTKTFVGKVMSLLFNMLYRFVIAFLPRSKCLLISWLQSPSAVILEPRKIKSLTVSIVPLWLSWYRICLQCRRPGFDPWVGKIPWRRERLPTPVFWPGEFHGLSSPWGPEELDMTVTVTVTPSICHKMLGPDVMILVFWMLSFKPAFSLSSFTFIKRLFSSSLLSAIRVVSSAYLRLLIFLPAILIPARASFSSAFCNKRS